jgi:hypothetical protein
MLRSVAISSLLIVGAVSLAHADVYRWVDDHGGVHYSDQWVPGSEVVKSIPSHSKGSSADATRHDVPKPVASGPAPGGADPSQKTAAAAVKQDVAKIRDQQCKDAKDKYSKAIEARRIYKAKQGGKEGDDREYLSDDEAEAYRVNARREMQDSCGSSATKGAE